MAVVMKEESDFQQAFSSCLPHLTSEKARRNRNGEKKCFEYCERQP
jgi:hypothetical protein